MLSLYFSNFVIRFLFQWYFLPSSLHLSHWQLEKRNREKGPARRFAADPSQCSQIAPTRPLLYSAPHSFLSLARCWRGKLDEEDGEDDEFLLRVSSKKLWFGLNLNLYCWHWCLALYIILIVVTREEITIFKKQITPSHQVIIIVTNCVWLLNIYYCWIFSGKSKELFSKKMTWWKSGDYNSKCGSA